MATHSSTLAWKFPWAEEPGRLQSMGSLRVRHDWATSLSLFTFIHWGRKWQPTPVFLPGESQGWGSLVAAIYGVAQSQTWLKQLSSSSSSSKNLKIYFPISPNNYYKVHISPIQIQLHIHLNHTYRKILYSVLRNYILKQKNWGFPDSPVVENLPANAGDTGSIPTPGRSYM